MEPEVDFSTHILSTSRAREHHAMMGGGGVWRVSIHTMDQTRAITPWINTLHLKKVVEQCLVREISSPAGRELQVDGVRMFRVRAYRDTPSHTHKIYHAWGMPRSKTREAQDGVGGSTANAKHDCMNTACPTTCGGPESERGIERQPPELYL